MGVVRRVLVLVSGSHTGDVVIEEAASVRVRVGIRVSIRGRGLVVLMTGRGSGSSC